MFNKDLILAAVLCTAGLLAAPTAVAKSVDVSYSDLDLATTAGQQALDARITRAAKSVCRVEKSTGSLVAPIEHACYKQALANARERVPAAIDPSGEQLGG
jgi:UrcA family protein